MRGFTVIEVLVAIAIAAILAIGIWAAIREHEQKSRCTDNGGRIEEYDCELVPIDCGSGCTMLVRECSWRCVGANAEVRP